MTKIKLCGISRFEDIAIVNHLKPEYIGFVFAKKSKRYVSSDKAADLKKELCDSIKTVGVFVNEPIENIAELFRKNVIDMAQIHGNEDEDYIDNLKKLVDIPVVKAFQMNQVTDISAVEGSKADYILLDSGAGSGETFDWDSIKHIKRPFFLAGGLNEHNVAVAVREIHPFAVDVSSGIETNGVKDGIKMADFVAAVRKEDRL